MIIRNTIIVEKITQSATDIIEKLKTKQISKLALTLL